MIEKTDMSERAIATRLRRVSQLRRLCLSLAKAGGRPGDDRLREPAASATRDKAGARPAKEDDREGTSNVPI